MREVFVSRNYSMLSLDVHVLDREAHVHLHGYDWLPYQELEVIEPSLRIFIDDGPKLYKALAELYEGTDDARALRKDYDAERARVDKFINALIPLSVGHH